MNISDVALEDRQGKVAFQKTKKFLNFVPVYNPQRYLIQSNRTTIRSKGIGAMFPSVPIYCSRSSKYNLIVAG